MKISEVTQKSHIEQLAEDRKQLDEVLPAAAAAVWAGLGIAGAGMTGYETYKNYQAFKRGDITQKELIARVGGDVALGLIGGGGLAVGKALAKGAFRGAKKLMGFGDDPARLAVDKVDAIKKIKKAEVEVDAAKQLNKETPRGGRIFKSADKKAAKKLEKDAKADLKNAQRTKKELNKRLEKAKIMPRIKKRDLAKGATLGLAVPDSLDPLRDPTYKALGGANKDGQPNAGSGMDGKSKPRQKFEPEKKTGYRFSKLPD
jgi:hypothetical protein